MHAVDLGLLGQVHFVQNHQVRVGDLPDLELHEFGHLEDLFRVEHADHAVHPDLIAQPGEVEGGRDPGRIGYPTRLEHDVLGTLGQIDRCQNRLDQVVADGAADTAVRQAGDTGLNTGHEVRIDVDVAEIVHEHGDAQSVIAFQDAIQQGRFPRSEEPRQDDDRHGGVVAPTPT